jgi:ATP-dependent Clp protease ATP-binding subunit ClpC
VFERFTESTRETTRAAIDEARSMGHSYVGTEHLLLGLLREQDGVGAHVLTRSGITPDGVRQVIRRLLTPGETETVGMIPLTSRAKRALEEADRESTAQDDPEIRPEHLLLGIIDVADGISSRVFVELDVDREAIRTATLREIKARQSAGRTGQTL